MFSLIVNQMYATGSAHTLSQNKVFKAFDESEGPFHAAFKNAQPVLINGEPRYVFSFDLPRFKLVTEAIAHAVYNRTSRQIFKGHWRIISPNLSTSCCLYDGVPTSWDSLYAMLGSLSFTEILTPEPEVFKCAIYTEGEDNFIYRFVFYNGFTVYAWAIPAEAAAQVLPTNMNRE